MVLCNEYAQESVFGMLSTPEKDTGATVVVCGPSKNRNPFVTASHDLALLCLLLGAWQIFNGVRVNITSASLVWFSRITSSNSRYRSSHRQMHDFVSPPFNSLQPVYLLICSNFVHFFPSPLSLASPNRPLKRYVHALRTRCDTFIFPSESVNHDIRCQ